jgi:hypothetical protein
MHHAFSRHDGLDGKATDLHVMARGRPGVAASRLCGHLNRYSMAQGLSQVEALGSKFQ